jgi:hypothetical protein
MNSMHVTCAAQAYTIGGRTLDVSRMDNDKSFIYGIPMNWASHARTTMPTSIVQEIVILTCPHSPNILQSTYPSTLLEYMDVIALVTIFIQTTVPLKIKNITLIANHNLKLASPYSLAAFQLSRSSRLPLAQGAQNRRTSPSCKW